MGLGKRNKVSAEFSMSSLTDIIFLLLIFFMLTSSLVKISSPFELPESDSKTVAPQSAAVAIDRGGQFMVNNKKVSSTGLSRALRKELKSLSVSEQPTITIVAEKDVPFRYVKTAMEAAARLNAQAIIATQPKTN